MNKKPNSLTIFQDYAIHYFLDGYSIKEIADLLSLAETDVCLWFKQPFFKSELRKRQITHSEILNRINNAIDNELFDEVTKSYYNWAIEIESRHLLSKLLLPEINHLFMKYKEKNLFSSLAPADLKPYLEVLKELSFLSNKNTESLLKVNEQQLKLSQVAVKLNQISS